MRKSFSNKYLLDTDSVSYLINSKSPFHEKLLSKIREIELSNVAISVMTASELVSGLKQIPEQNAVFRHCIQEAIERFLTAIPVLDFTITGSLLYGEIRAHLLRIGQDIGVMDTLIAAHALAEGRILVTNNVAHFGRVPQLLVENWVV